MAQHKSLTRGLSRRRILTVAGLATASAGLIGAAAPMSLLAQRSKGDGAGDPIMVRVRDGNTGALDLFVGAQRVEVHDPDLAARIVAAAQA